MNDFVLVFFIIKKLLSICLLSLTVCFFSLFHRNDLELDWNSGKNSSSDEEERTNTAKIYRIAQAYFFRVIESNKKNIFWTDESINFWMWTVTTGTLNGWSHQQAFYVVFLIPSAHLQSFFFHHRQTRASTFQFFSDLCLGDADIHITTVFDDDEIELWKDPRHHTSIQEIKNMFNLHDCSPNPFHTMQKKNCRPSDEINVMYAYNFSVMQKKADCQESQARKKEKKLSQEKLSRA